jgi:hypothetical protein
MSDNLNLMAIGTRDSYIGLYSLLNEPLRSLKGTINPAMVKDGNQKLILIFKILICF